MFQSIEYTKYFGYNAVTKLHEYKYKLVDSDFRCIAVAVAVAVGVVVEVEVAAVIQEYSKRKLNVAANLIRCFKYHEKEYGWSITQQIAWAEKYQPLFTPELKADLQKYLALI